jgi:hypothetical protein
VKDLPGYVMMHDDVILVRSEGEHEDGVVSEFISTSS